MPAFEDKLVLQLLARSDLRDHLVHFPHLWGQIGLVTEMLTWLPHLPLAQPHRKV